MGEAKYFEKNIKIEGNEKAQTEAVEGIKNEFAEFKKEDIAARSHIKEIKIGDLTSDIRIIPVLVDLLHREQNLTEKEIRDLETEIIDKETNPECKKALYELSGMLKNRILHRAADKTLAEGHHAKKQLRREEMQQKEKSI